VVDIFPDVIEVIVLAPCSDALLRVGGSAQLSERVRGVNRIEEDGFKLRGKKKRAIKKSTKSLLLNAESNSKAISVGYVMVPLAWRYWRQLSETTSLLSPAHKEAAALTVTWHSHTCTCSRSPPNPRTSKGTQSIQIPS